ncbi:hypothetical protein LCGC14_2177570 [marine sediment metagenome]|uniref:Methylmalonyl-CoA mutase domain-containing protein n=1 Tax=marine sediment metagenome TaxID=412755 RepID=A0A0F9GJ14_9ZZZZ
MSKFLFDEFESISANAWKQKIQVDLKGADYNETLLWQTNEDIKKSVVKLDQIKTILDDRL